MERVCPVKISEFAEMNQVSSKMLRYYDEIGLLKPSRVDADTGYRSYDAEQSHYLNWILVLKNLDFTLNEIKMLLQGPLESGQIIHRLIHKRIEIANALNEQVQKKIAVDKLIDIMRKEGFQMDKQIDLLQIQQDGIHELKKTLPAMEAFLDEIIRITADCSEQDEIFVLRMDLCHFKQVNDSFGYEVGDRVILAFFKTVQACMENTTEKSAFGRAHGDEFVVFAKGGKAEAEAAARNILNGLKDCDFAALGCSLPIGCYIGGLYGRCRPLGDLRYLVDETIEVIHEARAQGFNAISVKAIQS